MKLGTQNRVALNKEASFGKDGHYFLNLPVCAFRQCRHHLLCETCWPVWPGSLTRAVATEIEQVAASKAHITSKTLYVGGGVPLCLPSGQLESLMDLFRRRFSWDQKAEWTLEASISQFEDARHLRTLREMGFNRLNIGFYTPEECEMDFASLDHCFNQIVSSGFVLSLELHFRQKEPHDRQKMMLDLIGHPLIDHFSINLEYGQSALPKQDGRAFARSIWEDVQARAQRQGYSAYQHSHWGRRGAFGHQNLAVYRGAAFRGMGPAAASSDGQRQRYHHPESPAAYITRIDQESIERSIQRLSPQEAHFECMMRQLHLPSGIDPAGAVTSLPPQIAGRWTRKLKHWKGNGVLLPVGNGRLALNPDAKMALDEMMSDLLEPEA